MLFEPCLTDLRHISDNYLIRFEDIVNVIIPVDIMALKISGGLNRTYSFKWVLNNNKVLFFTF
jgi:hypothetical protein